MLLVYLFPHNYYNLFRITAVLSSRGYNNSRTST